MPSSINELCKVNTKRKEENLAQICHVGMCYVPMIWYVKIYISGERSMPPTIPTVKFPTDISGGLGGRKNEELERRVKGESRSQ